MYSLNDELGSVPHVPKSTLFHAQILCVMAHYYSAHHLFMIYCVYPQYTLRFDSIEHRVDHVIKGKWLSSQILYIVILMII